MKLIYEQMEFHNAEELEAIPDIPGLRLQRFPKEVRQNLGKEDFKRGRFISQASTGIEIRFVTDAPFIRIGLSATVEDGDVLVYHGDYFHSMHRLSAGVVHTLQLDKPDRFQAVISEALQVGRFSPDVWRIIISRNYYPGFSFQAAFHYIDTFGHEIRPPKPEELPARKWLAYGSSITHGSGATVHHQAYIQQAARRLGVDVLNKGMGGSCFCEKEMADYFMQNKEWDFATLELGVNMREHFSPDEFEARALYLVEGMLASHPNKPVVLISIYPNSADVLKNSTASQTVENNRQFSDRLKRIHQSLNNPNLNFVDGHSILTDFSTLTTDLIHPSDYGHMLMGQHLAEALEKII